MLQSPREWIKQTLDKIKNRLTFFWSEERYDSGKFTTYYGKALAVVRAGQARGLSIRVTGAFLASLAPATC